PETDNPLERRIERVARGPRCAPATWHRSSPQAASDGRPRHRAGRTSPASSTGAVSGSVVQWVGSWAWVAMGCTARAVLTTTRAGDHSACCAVKAVVSILIPGPWVVEMVTDRM